MDEKNPIRYKRYLIIYLILALFFTMSGCGFKDKKTDIAPSAPLVYTDDISRWKTYRNEKYGYEIKYPQYLEDHGLLYFPESEYKNTNFDQPAIEISSFADLSGTCLAPIDGKPKFDYLDKNKIEAREQFNKISVEKRTVNGMVGYREIWKDAGTWTLAGKDGVAFRIDYYFPHEQRCYRMRLFLDSLNRNESFNKTKFEDVFEKVVATFKMAK